MSNFKVNAAVGGMLSSAKNTHYAVSTFAAVLYAVIWLLSSGAHAEPANAQVAHSMLPAIEVTAYRTTLPELVVVGKRDATMSVAMLEAVVVTGKSAAMDTRVAAANIGYVPARVGYVAKMRSWVKSTLAM